MVAAAALKRRVLAAKLLIVDDDKTNRLLLEHIYRSYGFTQIETANNGYDALEKTRSLRPDLVVLDLLMPVMDGFEYCRRVRADPLLSNIPILIQTGLEEVNQRIEVFNAGATDLILKPLHPQELLSRTSVHLENRYLLADLKRYQMRIAAELEAARQIQFSLLPDPESLSRKRCAIDIHSYFATASEIGGDLWGIHPMGEGKTGFYLCDFAGHGIVAALGVFRLHALLKELQNPTHKPGIFLGIVNARLHNLIARHEFATIFYGDIDTRAQLLRYASAGALSPLLWQAKEKRVTPIESSGVPLGAVSDTFYPNRTLPFLPGDMLLLYSDALLEAPRPDGSRISQEELCRFLEMCAYSERAALLGRMVTHFFGATPVLKDDLTLILLSY